MGKRKLATPYPAAGGTPFGDDKKKSKGNKLPKHVMHARGRNRGLPKA